MTPQEALLRLKEDEDTQDRGQDKGSRTAAKSSPSRDPSEHSSEREERLAQLLASLSGPEEELQAAPVSQLVTKPLKAWVFLPADMLALSVAALVAFGLSQWLNDLFFGRGSSFVPLGDDWARLAQFSLMACGVLMAFAAAGHYRMRMPFWQEAHSVCKTLLIAMVLDGFLQFAGKYNISRMGLVFGWGFSAVFVLGGRMALRRGMNALGLWSKRTLLIGKGPVAHDARAAVLSAPELGYVLSAQIEDLPAAFEQAGRSWQAVCARYRVAHVIVALDGAALAEAKEPLAALMREHISFAVVPPLRQMPVLSLTRQSFFSHDVMMLVHNNPLEQPVQRFLKRGMDVALSGAALLALSPIMAVVAWLVRRDGGPAIFGHKRLGRSGEPFYCYKFRSMVLDSEKVLQECLAQNADARVQWARERKLRDDPRVTKLGAFLRRTSLDELPQLFNVFRGDMSLVGPRPIVVAETVKYDSDIAYYYRVRPGLTGLWQTSGRSDVSYAERVQMDSWYVRNWSLWHDLAIMCKTIPVLFNRKGAY